MLAPFFTPRLRISVVSVTLPRDCSELPRVGSIGICACIPNPVQLISYSVHVVTPDHCRTIREAAGIDLPRPSDNSTEGEDTPWPLRR